MSTMDSTDNNTYNKELTTLIHRIWEGKNEAIGLYRPEEISISEGATKIADRMIKLVPRISKSSRVLILGSGFGGTAQYIMEKFECKMDCIDDRTERNEYLLKIINVFDDKLQKKINLTEGPLVHLPYDHDTFDMVWAQDIFFKSQERIRIFKEIHRVLKPGARVVFTEMFKSATCQNESYELLQKLIPSLSLEDKIWYRKAMRKIGLQKVYSLNLTNQIEIHYNKVIHTLNENKDKRISKIPAEVRAQLTKEARLWADLATSDCLEWGILIYQKINQ